MMAIGVDWGQTGCCGGYIEWPRTRKVADVSTGLGLGLKGCDGYMVRHRTTRVL